MTMEFAVQPPEGHKDPPVVIEFGWICENPIVVENNNIKKTKNRIKVIFFMILKLFKEARSEIFRKKEFYPIFWKKEFVIIVLFTSQVKYLQVVVWFKLTVIVGGVCE